MSERISETTTPDYFDKARSVAVAIMIAAAVAAIVGSVLDWVRIVELPRRLPESEAARARPFSGLDVTDGWFVVVAACLLILFAISLFVRKTSGWAWLGFIASIVIGGVAIADFRAIDDIFFREMRRVGAPEAGFGLLMVVAAGIVGTIASAVGVAASPRRG